MTGPLAYCVAVAGAPRFPAGWRCAMARTRPAATAQSTATAAPRHAAPRPPKKLLPYLDEGNPKSKTYPRPAPVALGRDALLLVWLVVLWYIGTVVGNIYG